MPQNIYDDDSFFSGYSTLARSVQGLEGAGEWPSIRAMLPDMAGRRVVDLGCGFGWFCRWAREAGATSVLGLDLSEKMLARAAADTSDPAISYARADLDHLALGAGGFDLAYSSLALHYLETLDRVMASVHAALAPGGHFVFSVEHPIYTAPSQPRFVTAEDGRTIWPLDSYLREGRRVTNWFAPGVVKFHRTVGSYVTALLAAGFTLAALEEWGPSDADLAAHPVWAVERERPPFLLVAARRG
ncbi:MAG: methyltransferase domain-containing protein [Acetobacteraceae bacterium]|nr:methyltransferase domain-containing protein [Acetobacteraceae bacterium]